MLCSIVFSYSCSLLNKMFNYAVSYLFENVSIFCFLKKDVCLFLTTYHNVKSEREIYFLFTYLLQRSYTKKINRMFLKAICISALFYSYLLLCISIVALLSLTTSVTDTNRRI